MTDYTHYLAVVGEHWRGGRIFDPTQVDPMQPAGMVDPVYGQVLGVISAPSPTPTVNTVVRGATSGCRGRIIRILGPTSFLIESWTNPSLGGNSGGSFANTFALGYPLTGEVVNFDNGGSSVVSPAALSQPYPLYGQFAHQLQDATVNSHIPNDKSDTPFWDRGAKYSRQLILTAASVAGDTQWIQGARCTNTTTGATFTILAASTVGADYGIQIIRASGAFNAGDALAVTTQANGSPGTDTAVIATGGVGANPPLGAWVSHHPVPNQNGTASLWEFPPNGNGTSGGPASIGQELKLLRGAVEHFAAESIPANRGVRMVPVDHRDMHGADSLLAGVTVQTIKATGTFSSSWTVGETVTRGTWSAKVHAFNATLKYLFVVEPNGETLTAGTVTGAQSGATCTAPGAALGFQKGSAFWTSMVAELASAQAASGALWMSAIARYEGMFLSIWESEVMTCLPANGCTWPQQARIITEWTRFITSLRTHVGRADMPVAIWHGDARSHASDVSISGVAFAVVLRLALEGVQKLVPGVRLVRTEGHEPAQTTGLPVATNMLLHRPQDYLDDGATAWRAISLLLQLPPNGEWKWFPMVLVAGCQSQQVGDIPAASMMAIDKDPDLWPSVSFPGVNTRDPNCLTFNTQTEQWEQLDVTLNGNHFFGMAIGTCGPPIPVMQRLKGRFAADNEYSGLVGLINLPVSASSMQSLAMLPAAQFGAAATWDPSPSNLQTTVNAHLTVPAANTGRFTAAAGTFSAWQQYAPSTVAGSLLGLQGAGGNNTLQFAINGILAVAVDGSSIDVLGTFVAEGGTGVDYRVNNGAGYSIGATTVAVDTGTGTILNADRVTFAGHATVYTVTSPLGGPGTITFTPALTASVADNAAVTVAARSWTLTHGPLPIMALAEEMISKAFAACAPLKLKPWPVEMIFEHGESDLGLSSTYYAKAKEVILRLVQVFGNRPKGQEAIPKAIVQLSSRTPLGSDSEVAAIRAAQAALVDDLDLPNSVLVDPSRLPMESAGIYPRVTRQHNGIHRTARGHIMAGFLIDQALGTLEGIPPHPAGDAAIDFGVFDGGGGTTGTDDVGGGTDTPGDLIVEDGTGKVDAESLASVSYADEYWSRHGSPAWWTSSTLVQKEVALRTATQEGIEGQYGGLFRGVIQAQTQRLSFPRYGCYDDDGRLVEPGTVPWQAMDATVLLAADVRAGGTLLPTEVDRGPITRETKKGVGFEKTIEYADGGKAGSALRRRAVEALLWPLLRGGEPGVARS